MNVCYPHTSHTNRHTPPPGSKERKSEREGGRDVAGKEEVKKRIRFSQLWLYTVYVLQREESTVPAAALQITAQVGGEQGRERVLERESRLSK